MEISHRLAGRTFGAALLTVLTLTAPGLTTDPVAASPTGEVVRADPALRVAGSYLVQLRPGESPDLAARYGVRVARDLDGAVHGAVIEATPQQAELLAADRRRRDAWLTQLLAELDPANVEVLRAAAGILDRLASA